MVIKPMRTGFLCILCQPRISLPLLNLTADVAIAKLQGRMKEDAARTQKPRATPQSGPVEPYASERAATLAKILTPVNKPK